MGSCPYGACEQCQMFFSTPPVECHFWSPLKKTCIMSSRYKEDELEDLYLDHQRRADRMKEDSSQTASPDVTMEEFRERMDEMKRLRKGWLDGDGEPVSSEAIALAADEIAKRLPDCLPHVFPMESGGLSLEWFLKDDLCAVVEPSLKGSVFGLSGKKFFYRKEDWTMEASWARLEKTVKDIA